MKLKENERKFYESRANIIKALGHPTRLWMVDQLYSGEKCVCEFVDKMDADFSTISKHLSVLKNAGIVDFDKRGKQVYYSLKVPCILDFMGCVEAVLKSEAKIASEIM